MDYKYYEVIAPQLGTNDEYAVLVEWLVEPGKRVLSGQPIVVLETSKTALEIESEQEGFVFQISEVGASISPGTVIALISEQNDEKVIEEFSNINDRKGNSKTNPNEKKDIPADIQLTRKAMELVDKLNIDVSLLPKGRILREQDILELKSGGSERSIDGNETNRQDDTAQECGVLSKSFLDMIKKDDSFRKLSSKLKVEIYRAFGACIGQNVEIKEDAFLICEQIIIGKDTVIGEKTYIEANRLLLGEGCTIGGDNNWVAFEIETGSRLRSADRVKIDVSGGKTRESVFKAGNNCLLCEDSYINVCRRVTFKDNVCMSPRAMIFTHRYWQSVLDGYDAQFTAVTIEQNTWIGGGAQVMSGVRIEEGSVVMANSVVISNIGTRSMFGGVPAVEVKKIKDKSLDISAIINRISEFLVLRLDYLGYEPKVENIGTQILIRAARSQEAFVIALGENVALDKVREVAAANSELIIISYEEPKSRGSENMTVFILGKLKISGQENRLKDEIIDVLRRFGIRISAMPG